MSGASQPQKLGRASFDKTVPDCDVCIVGKIQQQAHPKTADHKIKHPFQLIFTDLIGPTTLEAHENHNYVSKVSDKYTKWRTIYLLKSRGATFQSFVQSVVSFNSSTSIGSGPIEETSTPARILRITVIRQ